MITKWAPLLLAIGVASCTGSATAPRPGASQVGVDASPLPIVVNPRLGGLYSFPAFLRDGEVFPLFVGLSDPNRTWQAHERLLLTLVVSSGDRESLVLGSDICLAPGVGTVGGRPKFECRIFNLYMNAGHTIDEVGTLVDSIAGVIEDRYPASNAARIRVSAGTLDGAMRRARTWPGVKGVDYSRPGGLLGGVPNYDLLLLVGKVRFTPATPDDGIIQAGRADTVTVKYLQPSGDTVTTLAVVQ